MNKAYRHGQILKLIRTRRIGTQEELARELIAQGVVATQVTLSRDIRELGLAKTPDGYREIGVDAVASSATQNAEAMVMEYLRDVRIAQNLLVLKSDPGMASPLAVAIDNANWQEVIGTVAGDDTVLVVTPDNDTAEKLRERLLALAE